MPDVPHKKSLFLLRNYPQRYLAVLKAVLIDQHSNFRLNQDSHRLALSEFFGNVRPVV